MTHYIEEKKRSSSVTFYCWRASFYSVRNIDPTSGLSLFLFWGPAVLIQLFSKLKSKSSDQIFVFFLLQCFQNFAKSSSLRWNPKIRQWFSWCCFGCKNMHCVITTWTLDMSWSWCGQNFPGPGYQWVSCDWNHWWDSCKSWHMYGEMWGTSVPPDISFGIIA